MKISTVLSVGILLISSSVAVDSFVAYVAQEFAEFLLNKIFIVGWNPLEDLAHSSSPNDTVGHHLQEIMTQIQHSSSDFHQSIVDIKDYLKLEVKRNKIQDIQDQIEVKFNKTIGYVRHFKSLENDTIVDLIAYLTDGTNSIEDYSKLYHSKVFGQDRVFLDNAIDIIKRNKRYFTTKTGESENVILFKYFLSLLSVEYKAMILLKIKYFMKAKMDRGKFTKEIEIAQQDFVKNVNEAIETMRNAFLASSREIYKLDPPKHVRGETYEEVTRFDQVYFTSEANFQSCNSRCEDYKKPRFNFTESYKFDQRQCRGTVYGCRSEYALGYYFYLPPKESDKRYNLVAVKVSYDNFVPRTKYGTKDNDAKKARIIEYSGWARGFVHCDICRCLCDEENDQKSVRRFSTTPVESDKERNMVVTGVQIELKNKIFYLKIRQSPLLAMGRVNDSASEWKTVEPSKENNKDIFKLRITHHSVYIGTAGNDIRRAPNYVVTKVQFRNIRGNLGLETCVTEFNINTGKLENSLTSTTCRSNDISINNIKRGQHGDRPIKYKDNKILDESEEGIISFGASNLNDDVGQSTVPFLDLQAVESTYAALSGVGLKFRSRDKSGGFIAPNLLTYQFFVENQKTEISEKVIKRTKSTKDAQ